MQQQLFGFHDLISAILKVKNNCTEGYSKDTAMITENIKLLTEPVSSQ